MPRLERLEHSVLRNIPLMHPFEGGFRHQTKQEQMQTIAVLNYICGKFELPHISHVKKILRDAPTIEQFNNWQPHIQSVWANSRGFEEISEAENLISNENILPEAKGISREWFSSLEQTWIKAHGLEYDETTVTEA